MEDEKKVTNIFLDKDSKDSKPQPSPKKASPPLVALKTCNVDFGDVIVELVKGEEVHGLTRAERDYLTKYGFVA